MNAIICWNYLRLSQHLVRLPPEQQAATLAMLSPFAVLSYRHLSLHGEYDFSDQPPPVEAGRSTLKTELLPHGTVFASPEEARLEVAYYLDTYFNLDRRHSALGYRSPYQFEHDLKINLPSPTVRFY